jgi:hypothetical protein
MAQYGAASKAWRLLLRKSRHVMRPCDKAAAAAQQRVPNTGSAQIQTGFDQDILRQLFEPVSGNTLQPLGKARGPLEPATNRHRRD